MKLEWRLLTTIIFVKFFLITSSTQEDETCGKPALYTGLIVGGNYIRPGQFPWIVAINQTARGNSYIGGGSLVSLRHVITGNLSFFTYETVKHFFHHFKRLIACNQSTGLPHSISWHHHK